MSDVVQKVELHRKLFQDAPPRRRWLRFSLRTLFVLVTVLGVWLGWQVRIVHQRRSMIEWIEQNGGNSVGLSWDGDVVEKQDFLSPNTVWQKIPLIRRLLGDQDVGAMSLLQRRGPEKIAEARRLFPEANIEVYRKIGSRVPPPMKVMTLEDYDRMLKSNAAE